MARLSLELAELSNECPLSRSSVSLQKESSQRHTCCYILLVILIGCLTAGIVIVSIMLLDARRIYAPSLPVEAVYKEKLRTSKLVSSVRSFADNVAACRNFHQYACRKQWTSVRYYSYVEQPVRTNDIIFPDILDLDASFPITPAFTDWSNSVDYEFIAALNSWHDYVSISGESKLKQAGQQDPRWFQKVVYFTKLCEKATPPSTKRQGIMHSLAQALAEIRFDFNVKHFDLSQYFAAFYLNYSLGYPVKVSFLEKSEGKNVYLLDVLKDGLIPRGCFQALSSCHKTYDKTFIKEGGSWPYLSYFPDSNRTYINDIIWEIEEILSKSITDDDLHHMVVLDRHSDALKSALNETNTNTTWRWTSFFQEAFENISTVFTPDREMIAFYVSNNGEQFYGHEVARTLEQLHKDNREQLMTYLAIRRVLTFTKLQGPGLCSERLWNRFPVLSYWINAKNRNNLPSFNWTTLVTLFIKETVSLLPKLTSTVDEIHQIEAYLYNLTVRFGTPEHVLSGGLDYVYNEWMPNFVWEISDPVLSGGFTEYPAEYYDRYRNLVAEYLRFDARARLDPSRAIMYSAAPLFAHTPFYVPQVGDKLGSGIYFGDRFLFPLFIDTDSPYYFDIGRLGMLLGHELGHVLYQFFKPLPAKTNEPTTLSANETTNLTEPSKIEQFFRCLGKRYSDYTGKSKDAEGDGTQGLRVLRGLPPGYKREAWADQLGLLITYTVYIKYFADYDRAVDPNVLEISPEQAFFLTIGSSPLFCHPPEHKLQMVLKYRAGDSMYGEGRLNKLVRNALNFNVTFKCAFDDIMNPNALFRRKCVADILLT